MNTNTRKIRAASRSAAMLVSEQLQSQGWVTEVMVVAATWYVIATAVPY